MYTSEAAHWRPVSLLDWVRLLPQRNVQRAHLERGLNHAHASVEIVKTLAQARRHDEVLQRLNRPTR